MQAPKLCLMLPRSKAPYFVAGERPVRGAPLRSLEEVTAEILALEAETDGLLKQLVSFVSGAK